MAKFRIKLTASHPTGSMNMRDSDNKVLTVSRAWQEVDSISPAMEERKKWLVIEPILPPGEVKIVNISEDSTAYKPARVVIPEPAPKKRGK